MFERILKKAAAATIVALASANGATIAVADEPAPKPFTLQVDEFLVVNSKLTLMTFDEQAAIAAKASPEVIAAGRDFNAREALEEQSNSPVGLPLYGRWCGPGYSGPGAPIDAIDEACMRHDLCYNHMGYFDPLCDQILVDRVGLIQTDNPRQQNAIRTIRFLFSQVFR
ncbi:MAG: phospholipase A2 family protein [Corynebacterium sp.]|nr:phospholipase A2 family protein [Corynebacterium sp.]